MTDLEDRLLKKNIPGKYSWWNEEDDHNDDDSYHDSELDNDDDEDDFVPTNNIDKGKNSYSNSNNTRSSSGIAGVKGVLADYRLHQEEKKHETWINRMEQNELMERHTLGVQLKPGQVSISVAAMKEREILEKKNRECEIIDDEDEEEKAFLESYHKRRLSELRQAAILPECEGVEEVNPVEYSEILDSSDPRVAVVVHLYETYVPACRSLLPIMENLSRSSMRGVRFLSLKASSASSTLDPVALPSVLIYRAGSLIGNLTPITQHLPANFTPRDVKTVLDEVIGTKLIRSILAESNLNESLDGYDNDSDAELDDYCKDFNGRLLT